MKKFTAILFSILCTAMFSSCEKENDNIDVNDIVKIRELLMDADCSKGVVARWKNTSSYNNQSGSNIVDCDEFKVDESNFKEFYTGLGNITSVTYNKTNNNVVIESETTWNDYRRIDYYTVSWYVVRTKYTLSFYTKSKH